MKSLDDFIKNIVTKEINEPQEYATSIKNAFNTKTYTKSNFKKIAITVCSFLILISGIVYATDIKEFVSKYFYNFNEGVDTAIENGYFDEPEMNYTNSENIDVTINGEKTNPSDISLKVKDMVMDDYNLCFTFTLKFDSNININNIYRINLNKVIITDENKSILYCNYKEIFDNYCNTYNLNYNYYNSTGGLNCYILEKNEETNTIDLMYNIISDREKVYPNSKHLNIQIGKIVLEEDKNKNELIIEGNWNISFNLNSKFYDRKPINYIVKNCNYDDIFVTEANLTDTGFSFKFTLPHQPFYSETDSEEIKNKKRKNYYDYYTDENGFINIHIIKDNYIENELGKKFYNPLNSLESQYNFDILTSNYLYYTDAFTLTKADQTDTLKIYFTLNLPDDQRNVCIELEKKS